MELEEGYAEFYIFIKNINLPCRKPGETSSEKLNRFVSSNKQKKQTTAWN